MLINNDDNDVDDNDDDNDDDDNDGERFHSRVFGYR